MQTKACPRLSSSSHHFTALNCFVLTWAVKMNTDQFIIAINLDKKFNMMNPSAVHSDSKSLKKVSGNTYPEVACVICGHWI